MPKHKLTKDDTNGHEKPDRETLTRPQSYIKDYWYLRNVGNGRDDLSQGKAHQLLVQGQMVSPENEYIVNIIRTRKIKSRIIYVQAYAYMLANDSKRGCGTEGEQRRVCARTWVEEREGRNVINFIIISKRFQMLKQQQQQQSKWYMRKHTLRLASDFYTYPYTHVYPHKHAHT